MGTEFPLYQYRVDAEDRLVWVDEWWLAFANENGAPELTEDAILGRPLWDFVSDEVTRQLYKEIHIRVRSSRQPTVLPFRCDSPSLQRHMRLTIVMDPSGELIYESVLQRAVPQRRNPLLESEVRRDDSAVTMCSCCKRALLEPLGWLGVEDICIRLRLLEAQTVPEIRYTVCPKCTQLMNPDNGSAA